MPVMSAGWWGGVLLLLLVSQCPAVARGQQAVIDAASQPSEEAADGTTSGASWITPERYPVPNGWRCASPGRQGYLRSVHDAVKDTRMAYPVSRCHMRPLSRLTLVLRLTVQPGACRRHRVRTLLRHAWVC